MPVAIDFGRCLVMRESARPGQLGKCPILIARMSVEGTGINRLKYRKAEISALVASDWMEIQARFCRSLVVWAGGRGFGARWIIQRPLVRCVGQ